MKAALEELWWRVDEHREEIGRAILWIILAALTSPIWLYAGAVMWENAHRDYEYPYSGFTPETHPDYEAEPLYMQHQEEEDDL